MEKIKVIVDQDARGPGTSDLQAILVFLQSDRYDVLGITTVSGDQWVREETQHVLRLLEIAERTDVPVVQGAEYPLLNSKEETERWESLYRPMWFPRFLKACLASALIRERPPSSSSKRRGLRQQALLGGHGRRAAL